MKKILRFLSGLTVRLQIIGVFLSLVGIGFGVKSYLHVKDAFGIEESVTFYHDLMIQLVIAIAVNIVVGIIIHKICTDPIHNLTEIMRSLASGSLDVDVPYTKDSNEVGSMARKVQIFKESLIKMRELEAEQEIKRKGAEEERIKGLLHGVAKEFDDSVRGIARTVNDSVMKMSDISRSVMSSAEASKGSVESLSRGSSLASQNVNAVAAAAEELTSSIQEISRQTGRSTAIAHEAVNKAKEASDSIHNLSQSAVKIDQVLELINDIAEQINLLALNATIEAARAGEAGKGFAVVASEVKNLAEQTGKATNEISDIIKAIQSETSGAVSSIHDISKTINEIKDISVSISTSMDEQSASTREIAKNMNEAAGHTNEVTDNVNVVSSASKNAGESANILVSACSDLIRHSEKLNSEVSHFVEKIKAA